jgi:hypothetical protein
MLYAALIAFGAYATSTDALGTDSPWPGALAAIIGLPLAVLFALPLLGNGPTETEREQHELKYEDQHRW